jgi:hypothetical protein
VRLWRFYTLNQLTERQNHSNRCTVYFLCRWDFNHVLIRGDDVRNIIYGWLLLCSSFFFINTNKPYTERSLSMVYIRSYIVHTLYIMSHFKCLIHFIYRVIHQARSSSFSFLIIGLFKYHDVLYYLINRYFVTNFYFSNKNYIFLNLNLLLSIWFIYL